LPEFPAVGLDRFQDRRFDVFGPDVGESRQTGFLKQRIVIQDSDLKREGEKSRSGMLTETLRNSQAGNQSILSAC
jgi:hypothetical protein